MNNQSIMVSFVIPCYCSEKTIEGVVKEIQDTIEKVYPYEIILVNDASKDQTMSVIRKLCQRDSRIKGIDFSKNFGQHSAIMAGYRHVSGDIIITLDDDGQTPANQCLKLMKPLLEEGYDVAVARYPKKKQSAFKNFGSYVNDLMLQFMLDKPKSLYCSSYSATKRYIIDEMIKYENAYPYLAGLIFRTTYNIANVDIEHREREVGKTNYTLGKLLKLWLNGFTAFSVKPLRLASIMGCLLAAGGFIYSIYIIIHKILNHSIIPGWSSTMAVQLIIGGAILCVLGLIGEYIGRIYICLNRSPQYVIKEQLNMESEKINEKA